MPHARFSIFWTSLIAVTLVTAVPLIYADDTSASSVDANGDIRTVPVNVGGKTLPVRVQQQANPLAHANFPDELDPHRAFSATNPMSNKSFALPTSSLSRGDADFTDPSRNAFATKSYVDSGSSESNSNMNTKSRFPTFAANSRPASGFDRKYETASTDPALNHPAEFASSATSVDQNRSAPLGNREKDLGLAADSSFDKAYLGPGAQNVPADLEPKENIVISRMSDVPSRPLSIDEVRNLINHETKPDTSSKPEEPSKPLNAPDYKPEPLRDSPSPDGATAPRPGKFDLVPASDVPSDDDKNDPVPDPGTMATPPPENSEPLPQH